MVGDLVRTKFAVNPVSNVTVVIPDVSGVSTAELSDYAAQLSRVADVSAVSSPSGAFVAGALAGPPSAPTAVRDRSGFLTMQSSAPLFSDASNDQLRSLHAVPGPGGQPVLFSGAAQYNVDSVASITSRMPVVLGVIGIIAFVLLFLVTVSVVLPLKALVLNVLSLTATSVHSCGCFRTAISAAWASQRPARSSPMCQCSCFASLSVFSMDYEVFVLSRIREYWLASGRTRADSDDSVALGLARTGRVVTAAALLMSISFAALLTADVSFMKMFGLGLTIAVLVDATLVRTLPLPALMRVLGRANWWAPAPLARLHQRIGLAEHGR
jgi:RND superfamily putative drug exporter